MAPEFTELEYDVKDGTAWIVFNRPQALNSFTSNLYGEFRTATRSAVHDDTVDSLVITGRGRAFATGGDIKDCLAAIEDPDPLEFYRFVDNLPFETLRHCPKVVIAAVNGICVGGGLITALTADIAIAAESSTFGIPEARYGLYEPWNPDLLSGRISTAALKYLALTGQLIPAREAERLGMILRAVPDEDLDDAVKAIIAEVRQTKPEARSRYKALINSRIPETPMSALEAVLASPEAREGMRSFVRR